MIPAVQIFTLPRTGRSGSQARRGLLSRSNSSPERPTHTERIGIDTIHCSVGALTRTKNAQLRFRFHVRVDRAGGRVCRLSREHGAFGRTSGGSTACQPAAMCNFEQLARWIKSTYLTSSEEVLGFYLFFDSAIGIFGVCLTILLWGVHRILPVALEVARRNEAAGRWGLGIMTGYLLAAFLLTIFQTFSGPRDFWGSLPPDADQCRSCPAHRITSSWPSPNTHWVTHFRRLATGCWTGP